MKMMLGTVPGTYQGILSHLISNKWELVAEGEVGAQLKYVRPLRPELKVAFILGGIGLFLGGFGLLLIIAALLDHFCQRTRKHFLKRETPFLPSVDQVHRPTLGLLIILGMVTVAGIAITFLK